MLNLIKSTYLDMELSSSPPKTEFTKSLKGKYHKGNTQMLIPANFLPEV